MALPQPTDPSSPRSGAPPPDWLMDAAEGATRGDEGGAMRPGPAKTSASPGVRPDAGTPAPDATASPARADAATSATTNPAEPVAWKAAASSIPKLREAPVVAAASPDEFPGFAQDALDAKRPQPRRAAAPAADDALAALAALPPVADSRWSAALDRVRSLPLWLLVAVPVVLVAALVTMTMLGRSDGPSVSIAQILQHPEAWSGRTVAVKGRAGETFAIGGSYVFDLRQARDTIVVYSRKRRPAMHEKVAVKGIVSIGYLDGVPRVAVLEDPTH